MIKVQRGPFYFGCSILKRCQRLPRPKTCTCPALTSLMSHRGASQDIRKLKTENTRSSDKNESKCIGRKRQISSHLLFVKPTSKTLATPMVEVIPPPCWRYLFFPHPQKEAQTKRRQHYRRMCQGSPIEHLVVHRGFLSQLLSKGTD